MTLREAANVAWHVRVNGFDGVTQEQLRGALVVLEQLAVREKLVEALVDSAGAMPAMWDAGYLPDSSSVLDTDVPVMVRVALNVYRAWVAFRDFKIGGE